MMKRKIFLSMVAPLALLLMALTVAPVGAVQTQILDPASVIDQFAQPLSILDVAGGTMQAIVAGTSQIEIHMEEFKVNMLPSSFTPATGSYEGTWAWGYLTAGTDPSVTRDTYIGPVVVATRNIPTEMKFVNNLPDADSAHVIAYLNAIDQSLHWANPDGVDKYVLNSDPLSNVETPWVGNPNHYTGPVPAALHLHGGEVPAAIDGGPDSWFTRTGEHGLAFYSMDGNTNGNYAIYRYPNTQQAAPLWFHDHTLGATRLNVYMGLAGAYALIDPNLVLPLGLNATGLRDGALGPNPADDTLIPLVIQDRNFDTNGQLFFNSGPEDSFNPSLNPEHKYWNPEFFGNTIAVNSKVWPYLNVKAQRYRFYLINGSNARTYILTFQNTSETSNSVQPTIWQIGTDGGYLDTPVPLSQLVIMPGERAEFIIDFGGLTPGTQLVLNNLGPDEPFGGLPVTEPADPETTGKIMQFRIVAGAVVPDTSFDPSTLGAIRTGKQMIVRLVDPLTGMLGKFVPGTVALTRQLTLNEVAHDDPRTVDGVLYEGGPLEVLVNNTKWAGKRFNESDPNTPGAAVNGGVSDGIGNYLTEVPQEGTTEIWEIVNMTADAHPIHTHLAQFQLLNREMYNVPIYEEAYGDAFPGGEFIPAYGPPLAYGPSASSGQKYGGNPNVDPYLSGVKLPPSANEAGWKDTIQVPPGYVTRFVVRFAPLDLGIKANIKARRYAFVPNDPIPGITGAIFDYVWHCHIVDHEDNEMMRPYKVLFNTDAPTRGYLMGRDY